MSASLVSDDMRAPILVILRWDATVAPARDSTVRSRRTQRDAGDTAMPTQWVVVPSAVWTLRATLAVDRVEPA
jgi:hypothetical protein